MTEREALERIAEKQQNSLEIIRRNGFVFDDLGNEPGNWQHLAFTLYTEICEIDSWAREALDIEVGGTGGMRVLITGVAGFVGSHLAETFERAGHEVAGVDTLETGKRENYPDMTYLDIVRRSDFYEFANDVRPELVIHCAASYKDPLLWHRDTDVNVTGAINVAAVAKHHDASIIYFQTVLPPISSYAISKIAGEHYLRLCGQPLTVFRLASVYGPRNLSGPIPTFYQRIKAGQECSVVQDVTRDFVYVGDLVKRVMKGCEQGTVEVRSGVETPIASLPWLIGNALGVKPKVKLRPKPADDVAHYEMDGEPQPSILLEEGIARTVKWYEDNGGVEQAYTHLAMKG